MQQSSEYCDELVKSTDQDRWMASRYADGDDRARLLAIWALRGEIGRIPSLVSEPALGEIRLRWWRDGLDEIAAGGPVRAHPVIEALGSVLGDDQEIFGMLDSALDQFSRALYGEAFNDAAELFGWLAKTSGVFDEAAAKALQGTREDCDVARRAGAVFAVARERNRLAPAIAADSKDFAEKTYQGLRASLAAVTPRALPAVLPAALTMDYLNREKDFPIVRRLRLFTAFAFSRF